MDADGQHCVEDAISLCDLADKYPDELILGSRGLKENVPLRSRIGNTVTRAVYRLFTGIKIHDTQRGLRAFSLELIPELLKIPGEHYEYEMNVLLEFAQKDSDPRSWNPDNLHTEKCRFSFSYSERFLSCM